MAGAGVEFPRLHREKAAQQQADEPGQQYRAEGQARQHGDSILSAGTGGGAGGGTSRVRSSDA